MGSQWAQSQLGDLDINLSPSNAQSEDLDFSQCWSLGLSFPI